MISARMQHTIAGRAALAGFGYWSGRDVRVEFRPAPVDAGITFVRGDIGPNARVPVRADLRVDVPRRTNLRHAGVEVAMVEHVLAALVGLGVDNCEVWVDQPEMPGCDGSSAPFVDALLRAGLQQQTVEARRIEVTGVVRVAEGDAWIEARQSNAGMLYVEYQLEYAGQPAIGRQVSRTVVTRERFRSDLAPCRTFVLRSEADEMVRNGLAGRVTPRDLLVFDAGGPIDNRLRFPNECARHKALDVVGDLALTGCRVIADIVACRSGHKLHAELARQLFDRFVTTRLRASA